MKKTIERIESEKIIAIVRNVQKDKLIKLCRALYDGGIRLVECTYDASGITTDVETANKIKLIISEFGEKMTVGAGTVLTEEQVELTKEAGGKFIISPDVNRDVIKKTKTLELVSIPGALTPSEITSAIRYGADFIKLFPVNAVGGLDYIKAVSAPLSNVKFLAVGGVNENNIASYIKAGFWGVGIGNGIVNTKMIENDDYIGITNLAKKFKENSKEN
ncbi:MAG: bifunctional 4-hydroxy-2-oxoglutarate aldolase/2-dehydro-3-deoxy-phosphogluconate aldolase [Oscillospiraceae bacterium]|nr:bifunctional 4-hydroxy-2-oxoglutarate aldolase/2-dehydro-3-deoxy-phosphogluconate aldolase [Oscillospiraceae bacterium]